MIQMEPPHRQLPEQGEVYAYGLLISDKALWPTTNRRGSYKKLQC